MASQRDLAVAYRGPDEVAKQLDRSYWMRARVRHRLDAARGIERMLEAAGSSETDGG